jgi:hypothetical protein
VTTRIEQHKLAEEHRAREAAEAAMPATAQPVLETALPRPMDPSPLPANRPVVARTAPSGAPTLRLGQINERLAPISLTAEGLAALGITYSATEKSAKLYHEDDFPRICNALVQHVLSALEVNA